MSPDAQPRPIPPGLLERLHRRGIDVTEALQELDLRGVRVKPDRPGVLIRFFEPDRIRVT